MTLLRKSGDTMERHCPVITFCGEVKQEGEMCCCSGFSSQGVSIAATS